MINESDYHLYLMPQVQDLPSADLQDRLQRVDDILCRATVRNHPVVADLLTRYLQDLQDEQDYRHGERSQFRHGDLLRWDA